MADDNLVEKATPRPWRVEEGTDVVWGACNPDDHSTRGMGYPICRGQSYGLHNRPTFDEREANAQLIVRAVNQSAGVDALVEAAQANFAWHVAEELSLGSFQARMELCNYAQWLTRKALGDLSDYQGVPCLLLDTQTFRVNIARCDVGNCKALVKEALETAAQLERTRKPA